MIFRLKAGRWRRCLPAEQGKTGFKMGLENQLLRSINTLTLKIVNGVQPSEIPVMILKVTEY